MEESSTVKLLAFCLRFQTEELVVKVYKSDITGQNAFRGDLFEIQDNHGSSNE